MPRYRVRKIVSRVEHAIVQADSVRHVEAMIVEKRCSFGTVNHESEKRISFEIDRIDEDKTTVQVDPNSKKGK